MIYIYYSHWPVRQSIFRSWSTTSQASRLAVVFTLLCRIIPVLSKSHGYRPRPLIALCSTNSPVLVWARTLVARLDANMPFTLQEGLFCFARASREGHLQALNDIRTRWRNGGFWLFVVLWSSVLLLTLAKFPSIYEYSFGAVGNRVACQPDGKFDLYPKHYHNWSTSGFFQITLGYGHLSFAQAKIIDIIWDVVSTKFQLFYSYCSLRSDI